MYGVVERIKDYISDRVSMEDQGRRKEEKRSGLLTANFLVPHIRSIIRNWYIVKHAKSTSALFVYVVHQTLILHSHFVQVKRVRMFVSRAKWCFESSMVVRMASEMVERSRSLVKGAEVKPDVVGIVV